MTMTQSVRKFALTAHVASSVALLGSIAAFLALAIVGLDTEVVSTIRSAYWAMDMIAHFVIMPLALGSLVTGFVQSLGTHWGLFRYYWVVAKLVLTVFATAVLLVKLDLISYAAELTSEPVFDLGHLRSIGRELALHATGGLMTLLVPVILSVYKPRGITAYGRRLLGEKRSASANRRSSRPVSGGIRISTGNGVINVTLRSSHVFGLVAFVFIAHLLALHLAGAGHFGH